MAHSKNSPPPPTDGASSGSPAVASAASEHDAGDAPAKKPWSRPTFYVLTDVIESHGSPTGKTHHYSGTPFSEDETIPPGQPSRYKSYVPATF